MIELRTLGGVDLVGTDGREIRAVLTQPKRLTILAYLTVATPRGFHRRDTLLALFWPELDQRHARASLRKAVHVLRHVLGGDTLAARGAQDLAVAEDYLWCDAVAFEQAVAAARLTEALELYRGDFLEGFFVHGAPEFERWHERERGRLRDLAARAAWILADKAAGDTRAVEAAGWARRAAAFTPDDETALRHLISLLYHVGDRAGALRAYDEFAERLAREFGVRPSAPTRRLVENVKISKDWEIGPHPPAPGAS